MTKSHIHRAVARATGEDLSTIRRLGFQIVHPDNLATDPEPQESDLDPPAIVNWDELAAQRVSYLPQRQRLAA